MPGVSGEGQDRGLRLPALLQREPYPGLGFIATPRGWTVLFGGNGGSRPRLGDLVARDLTTEEAVDCAGRLAEYYQVHAKPRERTARFMERIGMATLRSELLSLLPYIPLEKVP